VLGAVLVAVLLTVAFLLVVDLCLAVVDVLF